jgi:hypothetical protein
VPGVAQHDEAKAGLRCSRSSGLNAAEAIAHSPGMVGVADNPATTTGNVQPKTPLYKSRIGSRPHITLYGDGWGEGFGAWGLACCHDRRGAGVGSGPVASLPHMEPSRCPAGDGSGDTSVALELAPATHVGGQRPAPTGRMPGESPATAMHRLELAPHVWRLTG